MSSIVLGSSPQPRDFLRIQYEVVGKVIVHNAAALHCIEFKISYLAINKSLTTAETVQTIVFVG